MNSYDKHRAAALEESPRRFAEIFTRIRTDWDVDQLTEFMHQQGQAVPMEILAIALTVSYERVAQDGSWLITHPADVLQGPWLTVARTIADQLDAEARDRAARQ